MANSAEGAEFERAAFSARFETVLDEVRRLHKVVDPEDEPFRSKYAARKLLEREIERARKAEELPEEERESRLGRAEVLLGINKAETDELSAGLRDLEAGRARLERWTERFVPELVEALNQEAVLLTTLTRQEEALARLRRASELYEKHSLRGETDTQRLRWLEDLNAHTLFYLAQVYGHLGEARESARFCFLTLNRQLETKQYDPRDWVNNAMGLATYYVKERQLRQAHMCLDAAELVLPVAPSDPRNKDMDELLGLRARLHRMWGSLWTHWLQLSVEVAAGVEAQVEEEFEEDESEAEGADAKARKAAAEAKGAAESKEPPKGPQRRVSRRFRTPAETAAQAEGEFPAAPPRAAGGAAPALPAKMAERVNTLRERLVGLAELRDPPEFKVATTFEEARLVFLRGAKALQDAASYLELDGFVSEHVALQQDHSTLYRLLAVYEPDLSRRCKMHKSRANILEPIASAINPDVYGDFFRQLCDEIAGIYTLMAELKLLAIRGRRRDEAVNETQKINKLLLTAVQFRRAYMRTFDGKDGKRPEKLDAAYHRSYLGAQLAVARLLSKVFNPHVPTLNQFLKHALDEYRLVLELAAKWQVRGFAEELRACEQMAELLPLKMDRMLATGVAIDDNSPQYDASAAPARK